GRLGRSGRGRGRGDRGERAVRTAGAAAPRVARLPDLYLGLDRPAEGRGHPAPERFGVSRLGRRGVLRRGAFGRAGRDFDVLRPLGLRAVRAALARRRCRAGGERSRSRRPGRFGAGAAPARQHGALRARRGAARGSPAALRRHGQPGRRAASREPRRARPRDRRGAPGAQPLRPERGHDLLDLGRRRGRGRNEGHDRTAAAEHARRRLRASRRGPDPRLAGRHGRAGARQREPRARLPGPAGRDGGELPSRSVRHSAGRAPLPHPRPRAAATGRPPRLPRAALAAAPGVSEAAVAVERSAERPDRLVAYVAGGASLDAVRADLAARLPAHLVPSAWVGLAALPRTPNGKLDRKALPAPDAVVRPRRAPRTETERRLAALWAEVLGVAEIGAEDGFFDLGGHSLLAARVATRVKRDFGLDLSVRDLFARPTLAGLAARIEELRGAREASGRSPRRSPNGRSRGSGAPSSIARGSIATTISSRPEGTRCSPRRSRRECA